MTLKTPANAATLLLMVLAMALTFSCSSDEDILEPPDDALPSSSSLDDVLPSSSSDGATGATRQDAISLTPGQWAEGSIVSATEPGKIWYKFDVVAGATYYFWWNDRFSGPKTYHTDVYISGYDDDNEYSSWDYDDSEYGLIVGPAVNNGVLYLAVTSSISGLFGIAYNTVNSMPTGAGSDLLGSCLEAAAYTCTLYLSNYNGGLNAARQACTAASGVWAVSECPAGNIDTDPYNDGRIIYSYSAPVEIPTDATVLTAGQWTDGAITTANGEVWYKFDAVAGQLYYVYWDDVYQGSATYDLDIRVIAYDNDENMLFNLDSGYETGEPIILPSNGTVYLQVAPYEKGGLGSFSIKYEVNTRANAIPLTINQWKHSSIPVEDGEAWYKFTANTTGDYYFWWNDAYSGDMSDYLADIYVEAFVGNSLIDVFDENDDIGYNEPQVISLTAGDTVYILVTRISSGEESWFSIGYNDIEERPYTEYYGY